MKLHVYALALALAAGNAAAQATFVPVQRNNDPWLVISNSKHSGTNRNYNWGPVNPPQYNSAGSGVPAGTQTIRWLPREVNLVREQQEIVGYRVGLRASAATSQFPYTGYIPRARFYVPTNKSGTKGAGWLGGEQLAPDFSQKPLIDVAQTSNTFTSGGAFVITRNIMGPPTKINQTDVIIGHTWKGGEQRDKPNTQSLFGSFSDGIHSPVTVYFATPSNQLSDITTNFSVTWTTYHKNEPDLRWGSDWGYRRDQRLVPSVSGFSIGTGQSDLANRSGQFYWEVGGGNARQGRSVIFLFNFGPVFPTAFNVLGTTLELNIADPNLGALANISGNIGPNGEFKTSQIPMPAMGNAALNATFGVEGIIVDQANAKFESTGSYWVKIAR